MFLSTRGQPRKVDRRDFQSTPLARAGGDAVRITVRVRDEIDPDIKTFHGRSAWVLNELIRAGAPGCTPTDYVGPRWSDYCFKLRRAGIEIETVTEKHGGAFRGHHGRYILRTPLSVIAVERAGAK